MTWYCLVTAAKAENAVREALERATLDVYLPERREERISRRTKKPYTATLATFPRYLFVRCRSDLNLFAIRAIAGVIGIICADRRPLVIPDSVIDEVRAAQDAGEWDRMLPTVASYRVGEAVRIAAGPLAGFLALVEGQSKTGRVRLSAQIFGGVQVVTLPVADVVRHQAAERARKPTVHQEAAE